MKKLLTLLVFFFSASFVSAQIITAEDIEEAISQTYNVRPQSGQEYLDLADVLMNEFPLDINRQLSFTHVIEAPGKSKEDLYLLLNSWFVASFNDGKSVIQLSDKESGVILAKGYMSGVGSRMGFMKSVVVGEHIVIRLDIKDERVRLITSIQEYYMNTSAGVGQMLFGGAALKDITIPVFACYPFDRKQYKSYKKEAAIGYVGGILYSQVLKNKLESAINIGITGSESEDW